MVQVLVRLFVKDYQKTEDPEVRARYGLLSGGVGIFLNLCLFVGKFLAGTLSSSIAITADAFNNLSDAGSSVVTLVGFKMAGMPADQEHPFGHGRIEYLSGLAVSMAILLVGIELLKSSFEKILHPQDVVFSLLSMGILVGSIVVKLWMSWFNRTLGNQIQSTAMKATSMDSLTDAVATTAVAVGTLIGHFTNVLVDGWIGLLVAGFILYSGWNTAKESLSPLLGETPDPEFVEEIRDTVLAHQEIVGIHDMIIHDYGPGRRMISLHAEVPADLDVLSMHDVIDQIELELRHSYHCEATIHMDPIALDDELTNQLRQRVIGLVKEIDSAISIHDFRIVQGPTHTNLIFDATVPYKFRLSDQETAERIRQAVHGMDAQYFAVVRVEKKLT